MCIDGRSVRSKAWDRTGRLALVSEQKGPWGHHRGACFAQHKNQLFLLPNHPGGPGQERQAGRCCWSSSALGVVLVCFVVMGVCAGSCRLAGKGLCTAVPPAEPSGASGSSPADGREITTGLQGSGSQRLLAPLGVSSGSFSGGHRAQLSLAWAKMGWMLTESLSVCQ